MTTPPPTTSDLRQQVDQLSSEVQLLQQEQAMPAMVLNRSRNSICYIFGVYNVGFAEISSRPWVRVSRHRFCGGQRPSGHQSPCG